MKHLLNDMSEEEKNSIREQHSSVKKVISEQPQPNPQIGREAQSIDDWKRLAATILAFATPNGNLNDYIYGLLPQTKDYLLKTSDNIKFTLEKNVSDTKNNLGANHKTSI